MTQPSYIDFPYHLDGQRGRTAETDADGHVRDLIRQVLFTSPGERVNRPDFGCGLHQLVFMPNSDVLAAATQALVQGALSRWLDNVIAVHRVEITPLESTLTVRIAYAVRRTGETRDDEFASPWRV